MSTKNVSGLYIYLALGLGVFILGFAAIFVRWADAPGTVTAFYRMAIATMLMALPFYRQVAKRGTLLPRRGIWMAMLGGIFFGLDLALWSAGIVMSGATTPTLMANTAPLWVGLGSWIVFHERQNGQFWAGLCLAIVGATIVLGQDILRAPEFGLGTFLGLLAAIFYGAYHLITQRARASLSTLTYFWITTLSAAIMLLGFNLVLGQPLAGYPTFTYLNFLALGMIVQIIGWLVINYTQGYLPASIVAPTLLGQPVVTALFAGVLLGETLSIWQILGGVAVLIGVYFIHRSRLNKLKG